MDFGGKKNNPPKAHISSEYLTLMAGLGGTYSLNNPHKDKA